MDDLLQLATRLAEYNEIPLALPISRRVAYVVSHGQSYASNGYAIRTQGIAEALNTQGFEVLCFVRPGRPWELEKHTDISPEVNVSGVRYIHSRGAESTGKLSEDEHTHLENSVERFVELFRIYRPEVVIAASNYIIGLPAWIAAKRMGLPFYNEVRGFWELSREAREQDYAKTPDFQLEASRDTFVAQNAEQVFTLNQLMREELVNRGINSSKISVVPNGINKLPIINSADDVLRNKFGIDEDCNVIGYIGSFNLYEGLDLLLEACTELVQKGKKLKLLLIGDSQPLIAFSAAHLADTGFKETPPWLIQVGRVPHDQVADYYALLDTVVIPRKPLAVCQLVPPMKAAEALAYGKRLVVSDVAPLAEYAQKFDGVVSFEAGTAKSLATALQRSLKLPVPKPTTELFFAKHTEPMVRALKGEEGQKGIKSEPVSAAQSQGRESQQGDDIKSLLTHPEPMMLQPKDPTWFTFEVTEGQRLSVSAEVEYRNIPEGQKRKAVLLLQGKDANGNRVDQPLGKLAKSGHLNSHFMYLVATSEEIRQQHQFTVPAGITEVSLGLCAFNHQQGEEVVVRDLGVQDLGVQDLSVRDAETAQAETAEQELTKTPCWKRFAVTELVPHSLIAKLDFEGGESRHAKSAIVRVVYYDKDQQEIPPPYSGLPLSNTVGAFSYISEKDDRLVQLMPPRGATEAAIGLQRWNAKGKLWLKSEVACESEIQPKEAPASSIVAQRDGPSMTARRLADIKVAAILDEFTMECFKMEVDLTAITPDDWERQMEEAQPDLLFVESCWFGNANTWSGLMYGYTSNGPNRMDDLLKVIGYCRKRGIPTVFWAKEDPVHFSRFGPTAKLFDYVYTTDANMVPEYRKEYGIDAEPLSFFCQPQLHNPVPWIARNDKAAFAGSYYSDKIERCENFHAIMQGLEKAGVDYDIYDRCLKRGVAHLEFPEHFKKHVIGYLEPHEMWKAYKGYRYTVNLNTVKHSPTMFARRVYESLASGTPVISNYSEGVITQFGGIVCASDKQEDIVAFVERLRNPEEYAAVSAQGVRETLGRHTLADRLEQVCERLGIPVVPHLPLTNAVYTAGTEQEVEQARAHFQAQGYHRKRLAVNLENSNVLYPYLNRNSEQEVFRVLTEFAKPLEGIEVAMSLGKHYPETHLEDAAIETQYERDLPVALKGVAV